MRRWAEMPISFCTRFSRRKRWELEELDYNIVDNAVFELEDVVEEVENSADYIPARNTLINSINGPFMIYVFDLDRVKFDKYSCLDRFYFNLEDFIMDAKTSNYTSVDCLAILMYIYNMNFDNYVVDFDIHKFVRGLSELYFVYKMILTNMYSRRYINDEDIIGDIVDAVMEISEDSVITTPIEERIAENSLFERIDPHMLEYEIMRKEKYNDYYSELEGFIRGIVSSCWEKDINRPKEEDATSMVILIEELGVDPIYTLLIEVWMVSLEAVITYVKDSLLIEGEDVPILTLDHIDMIISKLPYEEL